MNVLDNKGYLINYGLNRVVNIDWTEQTVEDIYKLFKLFRVFLFTDKSNLGSNSSKIINYKSIIQSVTVEINITHAWTSDLTVTLISPTGTEVILVNYPNGNDDANFYGTIFDDTATAVIPGSTPPSTGSFLPHQPLSNYTGETYLGEWKLRVTDNSVSDGGTLDSWKLNIINEVGSSIEFVSEDMNLPVIIDPANINTIESSNIVVGDLIINGEISFNWRDYLGGYINIVDSTRTTTSMFDQSIDEIDKIRLTDISNNTYMDSFIDSITVESSAGTFISPTKKMRYILLYTNNSWVEVLGSSSFNIINTIPILKNKTLLVFSNLGGSNWKCSILEDMYIPDSEVDFEDIDFANTDFVSLLN